MLHAKNVALLYEDDVLGLQQKTTLGEELQKNGGSLMASVGYKYTQTDFTAALQTLKAAHPDLIVLNGLPGPMAGFVLAASQQGYRPPLGYVANYPMSDNSWAKLLGAAGEGIYVSGYSDDSMPIGRQYLAATASDPVFSAYMFHGYIFLQIKNGLLTPAVSSRHRPSGPSIDSAKLAHLVAIWPSITTREISAMLVSRDSCY